MVVGGGSPAKVSGTLLGGSWVVISWVRSALSEDISIVTLLITLLIPTHEHLRNDNKLALGRSMWCKWKESNCPWARSNEKSTESWQLAHSTAMAMLLQYVRHLTSP